MDKTLNKELWSLKRVAALEEQVQEQPNIISIIEKIENAHVTGVLKL